MGGSFFGEVYLRAGFSEGLLLVALDRHLEGLEFVLQLQDLREDLIGHDVHTFRELLKQQALLEHKGGEDLLGLAKHSPEVAHEPFRHGF